MQIDPHGISSAVREEPPLRIKAERREHALEIDVSSSVALSQLSVVVQRFDSASATQAAAADTAWTGNLAAGADRRVHFPLAGSATTARFVVSARGSDAAGGRIAATTVVQPDASK